ncbi:MAG: hypothetical protein ACTTJS_00890 [Wolinella sp.]
MPVNVIADSLEIHLFFAYFMPIPPLLNLYFLYTERRFISLAKKIKLIAPAYYFLMAVAIFSGIILIAMFQNINAGNIVMIMSILSMLVFEIKRHKLQKPITSHEHELQARFVEFAKRKYALDLLLLVVTFAIGFLVF